MDCMMSAISEPRDHLSPYAPKVAMMKIEPEQIKDVIGKGGDMINKIIAESDNVKIDIDDDEIGYVALHIHSALEKESVSVSMQMAQAVRDCVSMIEEQRGIHINVMSLSYNRLMNHVKYMVARVLKGESLKVNMNDYVQHNFPESYELATTVCNHLSHALRKPLEELEIGYLAMHIERVSQDDE